ncbi:ATP-dependent helicase HrpB [Limnoglobus roseus]|uniref:ATP-dependent helicase HrpB n=1 Tax=Limnoglobus roseus TaxID=2598579 RepID=A0A5C1AHY6_9BACT|nr:ATP-dependent helicase HrpB [Limnoglobus roseus]QEL19049.1 ATP-dependent helicase HrpB [Limnoglobus roseus]
MARDPLPVDAVLPELLARLGEAGAVVLRAPTGAGKTTRVPPALLDSAPGLVVVLEPRRVAARAAARRMAIEHGTPLGDTFGYHVRFDRTAGPRTRVLAVTPGVLLRMLQDNPFLEGVSAVVFDEFHERGLEADLALGLVRLLRQTVRPDLRAVVMSATLDAGPVSAYLGDCPVVTSEGRSYPVEIRYRPKRAETPWPDATAFAVREALRTADGDVLAFLPGLGEIRRTADALADLEPGIVVLPLHGELPPEQQDRALQRLDRRKVVLATNVAETSVTVDGVAVVVDTGQARQLEFDPSVGMDRLRLVPISKASADQRAGRAGRTRAGVCVRLWDEIGHKSRPGQTEPEARRVDLASAALHLFSLGEDVATFPWLEPPRPEAVRQAVGLLERLGAVAGNKLTKLGDELAGLPVHPRLGRLLIEGKHLGVLGRAAMAAAMLSDRDPFQRTFDGPPHLAPPADAAESDVLDRVEALERYEATGRLEFPFGRLSRGSARSVLEARDQLHRLLGRGTKGPRQLPPPDPDGALLQALFAAFPDRLARRRDRADRRGRMVGGRGVRLGTQSGVNEPELFVCVDVDAGGTDSLVRFASGVRREWLPPDRLTVRHEIEFDEQSERLVARKRTRFEDLVIDDTQGHVGDESEAAGVLAAAAAGRFDRVAPDADSDAGRFRLRVRCLSAWLPDLGLPRFDDDDLKEMLPDLCRGRRSLAELRTGPWLDLMRGRLSYQQQLVIDREAPDRLPVPSGNQITLTYAEGRPPVLAARIQELFGLAETPRVAGGRVKVLLHLLAPNHRPQQVTDDLASFWANGYPVVRKELRGRYPKHDWPDDPTTATASRGPRRRT